MDANGLEISVAVMPDGVSTTLDYELSLIRPALLYGDTVTVRSPALTVLGFMDQRRDMSGLEFLELAMAKAVEQGMDQEYQLMARTLFRAQQLRAKQFLTSQEQAELTEIEDLEGRMQEGFEKDLRPDVERQLKESGYNEIRRAMRAGVLQVEPIIDERTLILDSQGDQIVASFYDSVIDILSKPSTFPLLDSFSVEVTRALVEDGRAPKGLLDSKRGKEVQVATEIMKLAPAFPRATVWDILDIRKELRPALIRFRKGVIALSQLIDAPVFGEEFVVEAQDLIRREINPSLLDIEERIHRSRDLRRLAVAAAPNAGGLVSTGIALVSATALPLPALLASVAGALGLGSGGWTMKGMISQAVDEWRAMDVEKRELAQRDLYFVVQMDQEIARKYSHRPRPKIE